MNKSHRILIISLLLISFNFAHNSYAQRPQKGIQLEKEVLLIKESPAFIIMPENFDRKKPVPWVWFAPTIDIVPTENDTWYFEQFLKQGIAIAGIDVGESYGSPYGTIRSDWTKKNGTLTMNISVPANSTATVYVPGNNISESGKLAGDADGVSYFGYYDGYSIFRVEPGNYNFESSTFD